MLDVRVKYQPLHVHSGIGSVLDGLSSVKSIVERHIEIGAPAVCITDHAYATAHFELSSLSEKYKIKPIFAVEGYIAPREGYKKEKIEGLKDYYHLTLIAMNEVGYSNLMKISYHSFKDNFYRKPRYDLDLLERYNEGIICLQACLGSAVSQFFLLDQDEEAVNWMKRFKSIFGDRYYSELTWTNLKEQEFVNEKIIKYSEELDIKIIITPDSHYTRREDSDIHKALVCINTNSPFVPSLTEKIKEGEDVDEGSMFYTPGQYYLKSADELIVDYYHKIDNHLEYFKNTMDIADRVEWIRFDTSKKFPCEYKDTLTELKNRIISGLNSKIDSGELSSSLSDVYLKRISEELLVIYQMNFCDYFIMIQDIIKWANSKGITTGPGRGCFLPDTKVNTPDGLVSISDIPIGSPIFDAFGEIEIIQDKFIYDIEEEIIELEFGNIKVSCTKDHLFLTENRGWVTADNLTEEDEVCFN